MESNFTSELAFGKLYERPAAEAFAQKMWPGCTVLDNDTFAHLDFAVVLNNKLVGFIEVKSRRVTSNTFETTYMNIDKHHAARWGAKFLGVRTFAVLVFLDTILAVDLNRAPDCRSIRGRADRPSQVPSEHAEYINAKMTDHGELLDGLRLRVEDARRYILSNEEIYEQLPLPFAGVEVRETGVSEANADTE